MIPNAMQSANHKSLVVTVQTNTLPGLHIITVSDQHMHKGCEQLGSWTGSITPRIE